MSQALKAQEPSMEEILASIRRIIADDEATKPTTVRAEPAAIRPLAAEAPQRSADTSPSARDMMEAFEPSRAAPPPAQHPAVTPNDDVAENPAHAMSEIDPLDALEAEIAATAMSRPLDEDPSPIEAAPFAAAPTHEEHLPANEPALLSPQTSEAVNSAFNALAHTMLAHNTERLDELSRQMLRPMLKAWLDDNLPTIVERLVRTEIERVARGR